MKRALDYWTIADQETRLLSQNYKEMRDVHDLLIDAWNVNYTDHCYESYSYEGATHITYRVQVDIALKQAVSSILRAQYAQAIYNIRLAVENAGIAIYSFADLDGAYKIMLDTNNTDKNMRTASINYLKDNMPEVSRRLKNLHKVCDEFGSHQALGHHKSHLEIGRDKQLLDINMLGTPTEVMTVGLSGIVVGLVVELNRAMEQLPVPDWVVKRSSVKSEVETLAVRLEVLKVNSIRLWIDRI